MTEVPVTPGDGPRSVTAKVLAVLSAFEADQSRLTLSQIAAHAELPLSTAYRLVGELAAFGALRRDATGRYRIGRRLWRVAQNAGRELRDTARPHLADLFQRTGRGSHLAIRDGRAVLVADRMYGSDQPVRADAAGDRMPLHASAAGRVLLAYEEPMIRAAYLDELPANGTSSLDPDAARLGTELDRVRERGFAVTERSTVGPAALAVPVLIGDAAVAAIGLAVSSTDEGTVRRYLPALLATAAEMAPEVRRWPHSRTIIESLTTPR